MDSFIDTITDLRRLKNSAMGNPTWEIHFANHGPLVTQTNGSIGYEIDNRHYRTGPVEVFYKGRPPRIWNVKRVEP